MSAFSVIMLACLLTGCTSSTTPPTTSIAPFWEDRIDEALADPTLTDYERDVLSDRVITDAEYRETQDLYVQCMADKGWDVTIEATQYIISASPGSVNENPSADPQDTGNRCMLGTLNWIEPIYLGIRDNPQAITPPQRIRACFAQHDVPDGAGMSDEEFSRMMDDPSYHPSTPEGKVCFYDPTGALGVTIAQAEQADAAKHP